jgi:hypothetical protein
MERKANHLSNDITPRKISSNNFKLVPIKKFRIVNEFFEAITINGKTDPLFDSWESAEKAIMNYLSLSQTLRGKYTIVVVYINLPSQINKENENT